MNESNKREGKNIYININIYPHSFKKFIERKHAVQNVDTHAKVYEIFKNYPEMGLF